MKINNTPYFKISRRDSDSLVVAFSSINTPPGKFRFSRQLEERGVNVIYLNCENNSWYLDGVPGLGDTLEDAAAALRDVIRSEFPKCKVYALGSSMGAAGLIGMLHNVELEGAFAFCPEIELFGEHTFSSKYFHGRFQSKKDYFGELKSFRNLTIFYGEECEPDLRQIRLQLDRGFGNIRTIANEGHGVVEAIYLTEGLHSVLDGLLSAKAPNPKVLSFGDVSMHPGACSVLWRAYKSWRSPGAALLRKDLLAYVERTPPSTSYYPNILYWLSRCTEDGKESAEWITRAFFAAPSSLRTAHRFFQCVRPGDDLRKLYKFQFLDKFGQQYVDNTRAKLFHEL
ncbi:hypothetical protein [Cupriavidus taiwanensis]|uniref:hypothetical protein n=1 Tax=Cupriavidus taiwanensis TaxID=164546 RepID=UPI000E1589F2|nr:hypothetical protein [Cupriavidus taiwanensis]SOZ68304.1 hypothetical protein CBM2617_B120006 [Cupriavidus taiwanensis]